MVARGQGWGKGYRSEYGIRKDPTETELFCINVNILVLILFYSFASCYHEVHGKVGKEYIGFCHIIIIIFLLLLFFL